MGRGRKRTTKKMIMKKGQKLKKKRAKARREGKKTVTKK